MEMARNIRIETSFASGAIRIRKVRIEEAISTPYTIDLEMLAEQPDIAYADALGRTATVELRMPDGEFLPYHGIVTRFAYAGRSGRQHLYRATLRPWIWLLSQTSDCRIFQEMNVPDIVAKVFRDAGHTDFESSLEETYPQREYCVQYGETSLAFVQRLLESEGISYFFRHEAERHVLVLVDSNAGFRKQPGVETAHFDVSGDVDPEEGDIVKAWTVAGEVCSGRHSVDTFDFTKPRQDLFATLDVAEQHPFADLEVYEPTHDFVAPADGERQAKLRAQMRAARHEVVEGSGSVRGFAAGHRFTLADHPSSPENAEHVLLRVVHEITASGYETGQDEEFRYANEFAAIKSVRPFRPERSTPRPRMGGPQTAIVVGKSGEEIWTDEHGRVKVKFHWDRAEASDDTSSCWMRVAQTFAGPSYGAQWVPRIGHEVVVEFLEGDPDRPIIVGSVYNGAAKPPFALPDSRTQSGIRTRSSKEGGDEDCNELRFEDKKGEEEILLHAQKNQTIVVENDQSISVGNDETVTIGHDETITIGHDRTETIDNDSKLSVTGNGTESYGKDHTVDVSGNEMESIAGKRTTTVDKSWTVTVTQDFVESVDGKSTTTIGKDQETTVRGGAKLTVAKDHEVAVDGKQATTVTKEMVTNAKKIMIEAADEIVLKTGAAKIVMKKNGDITIEGKKISVKGSGDVILKGSKVIAD